MIRSTDKIIYPRSIFLIFYPWFWMFAFAGWNRKQSITWWMILRRLQLWWRCKCPSLPATYIYMTLICNFFLCVPCEALFYQLKCSVLCSSVFLLLSYLSWVDGVKTFLTFFWGSPCCLSVRGCQSSNELLKWAHAHR